MSSLQSKEIIKNNMEDKKNNMCILLKVSHGIRILILHILMLKQVPCS